MAKLSAMSPLTSYLEVAPCPVVIVRKAPVMMSHPKQKILSNSQQILFTYLEKRFQRYVASQKSSDSQRRICTSGKNQDRKVVQEKVVQEKPSSVHSSDVDLSFSPDSSFSCDGEDQKRSLYKGKRYKRRTPVKDRKNEPFPSLLIHRVNQTSSRTNNSLSSMGCTELAEHVVCRARNRLKRRPKQTANQLADPLLSSRTNPNQQQQSNIVMRTQQKSKLTPSRCRNVPTSPNPNPVPHYTMAASSSPTSIAEAVDLEEINLLGIGTYPNSQTCTKTIYLSEKQSITPKETGIPNVPPPTPGPEYSQSFKYIQSMCDIKSQRRLKNRLNDINQRLKQKEATCKDGSIEEDNDKRKKREAIARLKAKQRTEIYALNAVMRDHEERKFEEFLSGKV